MIDLTELFQRDEPADSQVPGGMVLPPTPPDAGLSELLLSVEQSAHAQTSALCRSRALLVASDLKRHLGDGAAAAVLAHEAAEITPKLALAACQARSLGASDDETSERHLEASVRLAGAVSSRSHAALQLARRLARRGDTERSHSILDHAARSGSSDARIQLERLVARLAASEPVRGLTLPSPLKENAENVGEVLGAIGSAHDAPYLCHARVARELAAGRVAEAFGLLRQQPPDGPRAHELVAAYLAERRDGLDESKKLLSELARKAPSRSLWRSLATVALESGDRALLAAVLSECDPGGGTFATAERLILTALAGQAAQLTDDDLAPLADAQPGLALALTLLAGRGLPAGVGDRPDGRRFALGQLLGAPPSTGARQEFAALLGTDGEASEEPLRCLLTLAQAKQNENAQALAEALEQLVNWQGAPAMLVAALVRERAGHQDDAGKRYAQYLSQLEDDGSSLAERALAERALAELAPPDSAWQASQSPLAAAADLAEKLGQLSPEAGAPDELMTAGDPGSRLAGALLEMVRGRSHALSLFPPAETASATALVDVVVATRSALRQAHRSAEDAALLLGELSAAHPTDLTLAVMARHFSRRAGSVADIHPHVAWLAVVDAARICLNGEPERALSAVRAAHLLTQSKATVNLEEHLATRFGETEMLSGLWLDRLREATAPTDRRYAYGMLAELDAKRGAANSSLLWLKARQEEDPSYLLGHLAVEEALLRDGQFDALETLRQQVLAALPPSEQVPYQLLSGGLALGKLDLRLARKHLEPLLTSAAPLLAERVVQTAVQGQPDDGALLMVADRLLAHARTPLDRFVCLLDGAAAAARLGDKVGAGSRLSQARQERPHDFLTELLAFQLVAEDSELVRAEALEGLALAAASMAHGASFWHAAGAAWLKAGDSARGGQCFVNCLKLAPADTIAFERLHQLRAEDGDLSALRGMLEARLTVEPEPAKFRELQLELATTCSRLGDPEAAKQVLEDAAMRPSRDAQVLRAHARLCSDLGDHAGAERSLSALVELLLAGEERTAILRSLGSLYETHLQALEKAMDAYQAALEANPEDVETAGKLVSVYARLGLAERATTLQTQVVQMAPQPEDKRTNALLLAHLYEHVGHDPARASATLERTRRAWPLDADVLEAMTQFMQRQGEAASVRMMLERAGKEARRKLAEGRLEPALLGTLAKLAELAGRPLQAAACLSARAAYLGEPVPLLALGPRALDPQLDSLLAPPTLQPALRALLRKTGAALDAAFPIDISSLRAEPLVGGKIIERLAFLTGGERGAVPDVLVSDALGTRSVPLSMKPLRLVVGSGLAGLPTEVIDFLLARTLKLQQLGAGALSRSRPEDCWPMLVALLSIFAPNYRPEGVDERKAAQARALVEQGLGRTGYDSDVPTLVLETIGAIGSGQPGLAESPRLLANRAAMLASTGPAPALVAMSLGDQKELPEGGPSRFRWLDGHPEARDLILFATSNEFAEALSHSTARGTPPSLWKTST